DPGRAAERNLCPGDGAVRPRFGVSVLVDHWTRCRRERARRALAGCVVEREHEACLPRHAPWAMLARLRLAARRAGAPLRAGIAFGERAHTVAPGTPRAPSRRAIGSLVRIKEGEDFADGDDSPALTLAFAFARRRRWPSAAWAVLEHVADGTRARRGRYPS